MSECRCSQTTGVLGHAKIPALSCPIHGVRASETPRAGYKIWVEIERFTYDPVTGDEHDHENMGLDLLSGAHVGEFIAIDASESAERLAQAFAVAMAEALQEVARTFGDRTLNLYRNTTAQMGRG